MMGKLSKTKGKVGEREVAALFRAAGFEARRGQQFSGEEGRDVVHSLEGLHVEVKRVEAFHLWPAIEQATADKREDEMPVVFHRKNKKPWVVVMLAKDWLKLMGELYE